VARHGQTDWNANGKICGRTDLPLNALGEKQAEAMARELLAKGVKIDRIIASPMLRTRQTAGYAAELLGLPVETDERLIEQSYGVYEGQNAQTPGFLSNKHQFARRYPGGNP
jgi:probable phosphoglycerate mutase